jgi:Ca2+-transporting ATPase
MPGVAEPSSEPPPWHRLSPGEVAARLATDVGAGLSADDAAARRARGGANAIPAPRRLGWTRRVAGYVANPMGLVLLLASLVSLAIGDALDAAVILAILLLNAGLAFAQEFRTERALERLDSLVKARAVVIRGGCEAGLDAEALVPGDLVRLAAGDRVPADLRLTEASALRIDESVLTGEAFESEKATAACGEAATALGDRRCMAYLGTMVTAGDGRGIVVATGPQTEVGRIAGALRRAPRARTPLQLELNRLGGQLLWLVAIACLAVVAMGLLRGEPIAGLVLTGVSLGVAATPEALPLVVTFTLAIGALKLAGHNALVRRLIAIETLGCTTVICTDKTGTLTANELVAAEVRPAAGGASVPAELGAAMAVSNDVRGESGGALAGDPTEVALVRGAEAAGYPRREVEARWPRIGTLPFDGGRRLMSTLHREPDGGVRLFAKGAPESVLAACDAIPAGTEAALRDLAGRGMRVIAFATRRLLPAKVSAPRDELESGLRLLGLVGLADRLRPEVPDALRRATEAGIRTIMVTGDHPATAQAIARQVGLGAATAAAVTGQALASASAAQLDRLAADATLFARVEPLQKLAIVRALQERGEIVALTGDGVNDAPALRQANVGVAMGGRGADIARQAADLVLLDDNYATIVQAIAEGRRLYDNIRSFVAFIVAGNTSEILLLMLAPLFGLPLPLLPVHILLINLVTDGPAAMALAKEPPHRDLMRAPPRPAGEPILTRRGWARVALFGALMAATALAMQAWAIGQGRPGWQAMVFLTMSFAQLGYVFTVRPAPLRRGGFSRNPSLTLAVAATVAVILLLSCQPAVAAGLGFVALRPADVLICLAAAAPAPAVAELLKLRRGPGTR